MTPKTELKLAYWLVAIFFVVGVVSYAAVPAKAPEEPVRIMFEVSAGNVLFTHKTHTSGAGYGIDCFSCHHHPDGDEFALRACGECHNLPEDGSAPEICLECHSPEDFDIEMVPARGDAFHGQCAGCHEDYGAGPAKDACNSCHVK